MAILFRNKYLLFINLAKCYIKDSQFLAKSAIPNHSVLSRSTDCIEEAKLGALTNCYLHGIKYKIVVFNLIYKCFNFNA
tara:strand:- start:414 stop:650 length:237 start_codon:yes stop_codon:yes gene_type:complete